ncbi:MAG: hypothetical protein DMD91_19895 [Candidatus Rokuibacteriota bacterium]|nr:MAG: hypothetical protein DMD91_19895 [Candidatus Rokubacteria bacterium]
MARVRVDSPARRSLGARLRRWFGITVESTPNAYRIACDVLRTQRTIVAAVVAAWLAVYGGFYLGALARFPLWGPFSTIDEQLQYYQVARNYNVSGFLSSAMLPDLSTASSPAGHPYLYNHQPPGPQLFIAVLMRSFGENFRIIRLVFAAIFLLGLLSFARFARLLESHHAYVALGIVLLIRPGTVMHIVDHPGKSVFPFAAFFPLIALYRYRESGRRAWLVAAALVVFVMSNYLMYSHLFMILAFWTLGTVLKFLRIEARQLAMFFVLVATGVGLHLLQTVLVMGWSVFVYEFSATLSNRMFGVPTRDELADFFRRHSLVLYGGHTFEFGRFRSVIWRELFFPARSIWTAALAAVLVVAAALELRITGQAIIISKPFARWLKTLAIALVWTGGSVTVPIVMFPAFASDYSLGGTSEFFLAIFVFLSLSVTFAYIRKLPSPEAVRMALTIIMVGFLVGACVVQARDLVGSAKTIRGWVTRGSPHAGLVWVGETLRGRVTMTNVDPTVVGFFTHEIAYGGCHDGAVAGDAIDSSACRVNFVRQYPQRAQPAPSAYVWVGEMQPFCLQGLDCIDRATLDRRYTKMFDRGLVAAYDLTKPL